MQTIAGLDVSRETWSRLEAYSKALLKWSPAINLVAKTTYHQLWERHIVDSAQIFSPGGGLAAGRWCDLGAGGGLPGIVLAILARELNPAMETVLIESDARKAAFLKLQADALELPVTVLRERVEEAAPQQADIVSARAFTALPGLLTHAHRHLKTGGCAIFPKGRNYEQEVEAARQSWHFDLEIRTSLTDAESRLLICRNLSPRDADA